MQPVSPPRSPGHRLIRRGERFAAPECKQDRDLIAIKDGPCQLLEQSFGEPTVGAQQDQIDSIAIAYGIPGWAAHKHVDVLNDPFLAEELETIIDVRLPGRPALGRDEPSPILLVEQASRDWLMVQGC